MSKKLTFNSYNLHFKESNKFKSFLFEINFINNYDFSRVSVREAMLRLLFLNNKKYQTSLDISKKCEELYDPYFYFEQYRLGSLHISNIFIKFINPKFLTDKDFFNSVIKYYFEIINEPLFNESSLNFVKSSMINDINEFNDDPYRYSIFKFYSKLDDNDPRKCSLYGTIDEINKITLDDIKHEYKLFMEESFLEISLVADKYKDEYIECINKYSKFNNKRQDKYNPFRETYFKEKDFVEEKDYSQSTVLMLYNFKDLTDHEKNISAILFDELLGGYSVNSILNTKIREEKSLCYSINSYYEKYDNSLRISTSTSLENINEVFNLVKECVDSLKNISEDELERAKSRVVLSLKARGNNIFSTSSDMLLKDLDFIYSVDEKIELIKSVSITDIVSLLDKLTYNSSFVLKGVKNEKN